jgi:hypothetical protein
MAKKKKSKVKKILGAALLAGLGAAALRNKNTGGGDPNMIRGVVPMNTGDTGMPGFTFEDMMIQEGGTGISPFMAAKGGRAGYGKGGKVSKGCGKVMAGRNKKTKYI